MPDDAQTTQPPASSADAAGSQSDGDMIKDPSQTPSMIDEADATPPASTDEGAPEAYEPFTDADGVQYTAEQLGAFAETARELGLSQEKAQKMFAAIRPAANNYLMREHTQRVEQWRKEAETDSEFGGANLKTNLGVAKAALDRFASPKLCQVFKYSGLGNHPEVIRLFYRIGKQLSQDTGVGAGSGSAPNKTVHRLYPNSDMVPDL